MEAYDEGFKAGHDKDDNCPYEPGTTEYKEWWWGYWDSFNFDQ